MATLPRDGFCRTRSGLPSALKSPPAATVQPAAGTSETYALPMRVGPFRYQKAILFVDAFWRMRSVLPSALRSCAAQTLQPLGRPVETYWPLRNVVPFRYQRAI